jgi:phosphoglycerate kinase
MKTVNDYNFKNKKALIRVDFNVPLDDDLQVTDDTRIRAAIPTIKKVLSDGGSVILMSHLGRPKGGPEEKYSLKPVLKPLSDLLGLKVEFVNDSIGAEVEKKAKELKQGEVLLLENLRFYKEEEKGDISFAEKLSHLGDVYVNDAFGTAHRAHASTSIIAQYFPEDRVAGLLMASELENAKKVLEHPVRPFTAIMGGAKVSDKIELIEKLLEKVDNLIIGGGMAYTFSKALGGNIGTSLLEADKMPLALELLKKAKEKGVKLILPTDCIIADSFSNTAKQAISSNDSIPDTWMGLDIGPDSIKAFEEVILNSKTLMWNGPMGVFEMTSFEKGTLAVANALVEATEKGAFTLIGGGDSAAAIAKFHLTEKVSYVSTGGGALLEYMEGKELPGVEALEQYPE